MAFNPAFTIDDLPTQTPQQAQTLAQPSVQPQTSQFNPAFTAADLNMAQQGAVSSPVQNVPRGTFSNFGLGALGATRNFLQDVADLPPTIAPSLFPKGQLPQVPQGQGLAYGAGQLVGNIAPFLAGGEALEGLRGLAAGSELPAISQVAQALGGSRFLPTLGRQTIGGATYGAVTNPQDQGMGAATGAGLSAGLATLPGALGLAGKAFKGVQPDPFIDKMMQDLGNGNTIEGNQQSIAQDIKNAYEARTTEGNALYDSINSAVGDSPIYSRPLAGVGVALGQFTKQPLGLYQQLPNSVKNSLSSDASALDKQFTLNPNYSNAKELQKQIGSDFGSLQYRNNTVGLDATGKTDLANHKTAYDAIKRDMSSYLTTLSPDLANQSNIASDYWKDNVVPYKNNSSLYKIATGDETNPTNLKNIFSSPDADTLKVASDLSSDTHDKIMFNSLGKNPATLTPARILKDYENLSSSGLGSYITPNLSQQISSLQNRVGLAKLASGAAGGAAGMAISPHGGEAIGAVLGTLLSPKAMAGIARNIPLISPIARGIGTGIRNLYPYASTAIRATAIPGGQ